MSEGPPNLENIGERLREEKERGIEKFIAGLPEIKTLEDLLTFAEKSQDDKPILKDDLVVVCSLVSALSSPSREIESEKRKFLASSVYDMNLSRLSSPLKEAIHDKFVRIVGLPEKREAPFIFEGNRPKDLDR